MKSECMSFFNSGHSYSGISLTKRKVTNINKAMCFIIAFNKVNDTPFTVKYQQG